MSSQFYPIAVANRRQETGDTISLSFAVPPHLAQIFAYTQGQHLIVKAIVDGHELRRNYSLCSSPVDGEWRIAVKRVAGGKFSNFLHNFVFEGTVLDLLPPTGRFFTPLLPQQSKHYAAVAAGSGITPLLSIIKTTLATEPHSRFTLVYANKNSSSIIFLEALEALKNQYLQRFRLVHVLSQEGGEAPLLHGRLNAEKCKQLFDVLLPVAQIDDWFLCGPQALTETVLDVLQAAGVSHKAIHTELFGAAKQQSAAADTPVLGEAGRAKATLKIDGVSRTYQVPMQGLSLLDAAIAQGANLPFACKAGVCCTCKAKLVKGEVQMAVYYGLEQDEIAAGMVLTCQSRPLTGEVELDFDAS